MLGVGKHAPSRMGLESESHPKYSVTLQTDVRAAHNNVANVQISIDDDVAIIIDGHAADGYARS